MKTTLAKCPVGLFMFNDSLCLKTEYHTNGQSDAYLCESGEYFWGGTSEPREREQLMVESLRGRIKPDPELLLALKECLSLLDSTYQQCATGSEFWKQYPAVQGNARAAIAKAEGKL